ncbi:hypothetical protein GCM10027270_08300 [Nocardioides ginkgobilobae]
MSRALPAAAVLLLALVLAACGGDDPVEMPTVDGAPAADAGDTVAGLQVRPVLGQLAELGCDVDGEPEAPGNAPADEEAALCDLDGIGYRLGPAVAGQEGVEAAELYRTGEAWRIQVTLDPEATDAVAGLAEDAASSDSQIALVVDGLVLNAPTVGGTIGGTLQLVGSWTGAQAEDYRARIAP